jgi:O-antigen ligase
LTARAFALGSLAVTGAVAGGSLAGGWVALDPRISAEWATAIGAGEVFARVRYPLTILMALLAALGGVVLARRDRLSALRVPILVSAVFVSVHLMAIDWGPINPLNVVIVIIVALWPLERLARPHAPWQPSAFAGLLTVFLGVVFLSAIGRHPIEVLRGFVTVVPKLVLAVVLADLLTTRRRVRAGGRAFLAGALVAGLAGIAQVVLWWLWDFELTLADKDMNITVSGLYRATGFAHTAQGFAEPLVVSALMAMYLACSLAGFGRRLALALLSVVSIVAVALSVARAAWLALIVGIVLLPFIAAPRRTLHWILLWTLVVTAGIVSGVLPWTLAEVDRISDRGLAERRDLLQTGVTALREHPWNGVGIGNFGSASHTVERYPVHNAFVQAASELGVPGLVLFVTLTVWVAVQLIRARRRARDATTRAWAGAFLAGWVGLVVAIQSDPMAFSELVWTYLVLAEATARLALGAPILAGGSHGD